LLTPDLLPVRRKNGELTLVSIVGKTRQQYLELGEQVVTLAGDCAGASREQLQNELSAIGRTPAETRIVRGFAKLVEDQTTFEQDSGREAVERRRDLFEQAAAAWQALPEGERFDRSLVLRQVAGSHGLDPAEFEAELFVDLPSAQRVVTPVRWTAEQLVDQYEQARVAAVLLRAASVQATFRVGNVFDVRGLFRTLRFRQLMFELERLADGRYRLTLNGPYSLFESVTKYGLQLALCWPLLRALDHLALEADLRWGKGNERLKFRLDPSSNQNGVATVSAEPPLAHEQSEEVRELSQALSAAAPDATVSEGDCVLELPGVGLCIPDLCYRSKDGTNVYLEMMGHWSRQSVWRRVELVEAGLVEPVLFLLPSRLRVSEEVLDERLTGALYVYRGRINPTKVLAKLKELVERKRSRQRTVRPSK
jgi:uncharacterized protein